MLQRLLVILFITVAMAFHPAYAVDQFAQNNPDVKKYEFARSYISALSYMKDINDRWHQNAPKKLFPNDKEKMILATINDLMLDNSDLRVFKDYLLKYLTSPNMLMRKVADMVIVAASKEISINEQEKTLWQKWYDLNVAGQATRPKEVIFVKQQYAMELRRKEQDKNIIKASMLLTKVLISDQNKNGHGHVLAITAQQRQKLLDKLDSYGKDELDWGLASGQTAIEGSIAVIREVLEDSIWVCIDEK